MGELRDVLLGTIALCDLIEKSVVTHQHDVEGEEIKEIAESVKIDSSNVLKKLDGQSKPTCEQCNSELTDAEVYHCNEVEDASICGNYCTECVGEPLHQEARDEAGSL